MMGSSGRSKALSVLRGVEHSPFFFATSFSGETVTLEGADVHHLVVVRRAHLGDGLTICDGRGAVHRCEVISVGARVEARIVSSVHVEKTVPSVTVFQALPKGDKRDAIVQKLVEVGVHRIVLFRAELSIPRWDERRSGKNLDRLRHIALEAAKQSRQPWLPEVSFGDVALDGSDGHLVLVAHETADVRLRDVLPKVKPLEISLVIGPEGGLTSNEVQRFVARGARPVQLGPGILRTETAALVFASVVLFHYGLLG